jgi:hypothetical protein
MPSTHTDPEPSWDGPHPAREARAQQISRNTFLFFGIFCGSAFAGPLVDRNAHFAPAPGGLWGRTL